MCRSKNMIGEDPSYNTKMFLFSFTWAGLAAFHKYNEGCSKCPDFRVRQKNATIKPAKYYPTLLCEVPINSIDKSFGCIHDF